MNSAERRQQAQGLYGYGQLMQAPPVWHNLALEAAQLIREHHKGVGTHDWCKAPGTPEGFGSDYWGNLGQLAVRAWTYALDVPWEHAELYYDNMDDSPGWDHKVNGWTMDAKATPPNGTKAEKKKPASNGPRRVLMTVLCNKPVKWDFYVAVKWFSRREYMISGYATGKEVKEAERDNFGGKHESYKIALANLHELTPAVFALPKGE